MSKKFKKVESEVKSIEEVASSNENENISTKVTEEVEVEVASNTKNENIPTEVNMEAEEKGELIDEQPSISIEDMKDREILEQIYWLLKDIEVKLAATPVIEAKTNKVGRVGTRKTPNQKKEYKTELLAKGPYTKEQLIAMKRSDLAMYAGALELGKAK
jgi:hypothetical protein